MTPALIFLTFLTICLDFLISLCNFTSKCSPNVSSVGEGRRFRFFSRSNHLKFPPHLENVNFSWSAWEQFYGGRSFPHVHPKYRDFSWRTFVIVETLLYAGQLPSRLPCDIYRVSCIYASTQVHIVAKGKTTLVQPRQANMLDSVKCSFGIFGFVVLKPSFKKKTFCVL